MYHLNQARVPTVSDIVLKRTNSLLLGTMILLNLSFFRPDAIQSQELTEGQQSLPKRLQRKDSYFGVHFDFHAELTDKNIGQHTTPEMVNAIIDIIHPDYIEVDTKGHPGVSSYPTKVGNHGGSFVGDPLKVWREVTAKRGVALYGHHSGTMDRLAREKNPQWAAIGPQGEPISKASLFGPFTDKLLIPQLIELAVDYKLDGVWVDGDIWELLPDYCDAAKNAFTQQTGIKTFPKKPDDPKWFEWTEFQREALRNHLRHYIAKVKEQAPGFQICSNWTFTDMMPELVACDVDFISGDIYGGDDCVNVSRYVSRLVASQGTAWDLMSWSFVDWSLKTLDPPQARKSAIQLMQEAACVIAQGGGYQAVFTQAGAGTPPLRDGSVDLEKLKPMGEVGKFCRERQEVCFKAKPVPQIAVLCSTDAAYRRWSRMGDILFSHRSVAKWNRQLLARKSICG